MPIINTELNIGNNIAELVEKPVRAPLLNVAKIYKIAWTSNSKYHSEYITKETMEKLVRNGHVKHCQIVNNSIYGEYINCNCKVKELEEYEMIAFNAYCSIINATNEFSDLSFPKMEVTTLIFGNNNLVKAGIIEYKGKEYRCTINELIEKSKKTFYDAYTDTYRPAFSIGNSMKMYLSREEIRKEQELGYSVVIGGIFGQAFLRVPVTYNLNLKTAQKYLSDKYKIVVEHDSKLDEFDKIFNEYISKAIGRKEISSTDSVECLYRITYVKGRKSAKGKDNLYIFRNCNTNDIFIFDGTKFDLSSFMRRNFSKQRLEPKKEIDFDYYLGSVYCDTAYNAMNNSLMIEFNFKRA